MQFCDLVCWNSLYNSLMYLFYKCRYLQTKCEYVILSIVKHFSDFELEDIFAKYMFCLFVAVEHLWYALCTCVAANSQASCLLCELTFNFLSNCCSNTNSIMQYPHGKVTCLSVCLLISAPSQESLLSTFDSVCRGVRMSVCLSHKLHIASSFLFLDGIEPFFGRQFSMWHSTKRCSQIFDIGSLTLKIYSPKFAQNRL